MNLHPHRIPADVFLALSEGGGGAAAVRHLAAAQYSKHVLLIRQVVESARASGHEQAAQAREAYGLLAEAQDRARDAVDAILRHPPVAAWAQQTIRGLADVRTRRHAVPGQLAAVAAAAAIRSGVDWSAELPVNDGAVMLPSLGRIALPSGAAGGAVRVSIKQRQADAVGDGWRVQIPADPAQDSAGWRGLRRLHATAGGKQLQIVIEDLDPYRMPGSANLSPRLSTAELQRWQAALHDGWELLACHHEAVADEVAAAVRVFTPLLPPPRGQVSATCRSTFGSIALSAPPDACSFAVTLAHENQHAKLSALLDMAALLLPDDASRHYAPWRDDPRPLSGLLQGAYAFLGVAGFWRRQRTVAQDGPGELRAHAEFARWRDAVSLVAGTLLASGQLTELGNVFVAGIMRTLRAWKGEAVPREAAELAHRLAHQHQARWSRENGLAAAERISLLRK
jgi:HEXXH motif-containing protein